MMEAVWEIYAAAGMKGKAVGGAVVWSKNGKTVRRKKYRFSNVGSVSHNLACLNMIQLALDPLRERCSSDEVIVHIDSEYAVTAALGTIKAKKNKNAISSLQRTAKEFGNLEYRVGIPRTKEGKSAKRNAKEAVTYLKDVTNLIGGIV